MVELPTGAADETGVGWAKARTSAFTRVFGALWPGPRLLARVSDVGTPLSRLCPPYAFLEHLGSLT
jgi:hypothetical protein